MSQEPLVTVIICAYNAGPYLRDSALSILRQTHKNIELIVVDDGSTDGSVEAASSVFTADQRVRVIRQANAGKSAALNAALCAAHGTFYAINDADDLSYPTRIERQVRVLLENPDVAGVFCGYELILDGSTVAPRCAAKDPSACRRDIEAFRMPGHDPTALYRTAMVKDVHYDTNLPIGQGFDYILQVGERLPLAVLGECLYSYRVHLESVTKKDPRRREAFVEKVIRKACARRGMDAEAVLRERASRRTLGTNALADNNLAAHFMESVLDQRRQRKRLAAIETGARCARLHLLDLHYYKALTYAIAPEWIIGRLRRRVR